MKPRLYVVDAHAYLHRAYHALPPLTNSKGEPVGALYGFARTLLQLLKKERPDRVAVCFDHPGPTFRHKAFEAYKATRKEIDGDLQSQLKRSRELAEAMGFVCVEVPGYEADDLMATLARKAAQEGFDAVLVTGDKDALQMVGPGIRVLKDVTNGVWMDPPDIENKLGVPPSAVVDYLAIIGDASDNVPGVRGIGPVGAVKLLKRYGHLPEAIQAAKAGDPEIAPKTARALIDGEKTAAQAMELLRLEDRVPLAVEPDDCRLPEAKADRLVPLFERLEFNSLLKEMAPERASSSGDRGAGVKAMPAAAEAPSAEAAVEERPWEDIRGELLRAGAVTVTALRNNGNLVDASRVHLALGLADGRVAVLDEEAIAKEKKAIAGLLSGKAMKVAYGLKDTEAALELSGLKLAGPLFDTLIASYCLNPVRPKADTALGEDWRGALLKRAAKALGHQELRGRMESLGVLKLYEDVELPLIAVLRDMESAGVALDLAYLTRLSAEFEADIASLKAKLDEMAGFPINVNSPKQLSELLYDKLGLPVLHKTAKGGRSTDEECLSALAGQHPIPAKVLEYRELTKLKSTYIDGLLDRVDRRTARVHTRFDQTGAETGRLSSLNPNLQNIPIRSAAGQKIRRAFVAPKGCALVSADYSQIDLRVLAHVSGDEVLRDSFLKNEDIHLRTACEVFHAPADQVDAELRRRAKAVNFGIVYGQTAFGLSGQLGIPQREAAAIIQKYFERYRGVSAWLEKNLEEARREGLARTFLGRVRFLPELSAKNTALRQFGERAARNTPIQGGSADIIKVAMLKVHQGLSAKKLKARMLLQIHDELLFEAPNAEVSAFVPWVRKAMEQAAALSVPLVVDVKAGRNWQDMERLP